MITTHSVRLAFAVLVAALGIAEACSPETSKSPIDSNGGGFPVVSGGGSSVSDAGSSGASDAGAEDAEADGEVDAGANVDAGPIADAGTGNCNGGNCSGCCDTQGVCQGGTLATACGQLGFACVVCDAATSCASGFCQP